MASRKIQVEISNEAKKSISDIAKYIEINGYPNTAENYAKELLSFANTLSFFPLKYPICRKPSFAKRKFHCAVFEHYIFVYIILDDRIIIQNVLHGRRIK